MFAVFVRSPLRADQEPSAVLPSELAAPAPGQEPLVARLREGPFFPLSRALASDARLTDDLARALETDSVRRYASWRRWLWLGLIPLLVMMELERELVQAGVDGIARRLFADALFLTFSVVELARPLPRAPRVVALAWLAVGLRFADMAARACGDQPALLPLGAVSSLAAVVLVLLAPSRARLREEVRATVMRGGTAPRPTDRLELRAVGGALVVAAGLPLLLFAAREAHASSLTQGALLAVWSLLAPWAFDRWAESPRRGRAPSASRLASAMSVGLVATVALAHAWHYGSAAAAHAWQCRSPGTFEGSIASRLLASRSADATADLAGARARWLYIAMTVLVVPIAEERVFRGVLQRSLVGRFGRARGLAGAAAVFGLAHLGVYGAAAFDAALLGLGFGLAFEEGGLLAAALAHGAWNLYWLW